jgi:L-alanine-DL-glutamate epimerase-like enolase superfamily enzyme
MQIQGVQAFLLSYPFEKPIALTYFGGDRVILKRDAMLIRVEASNGLVGYAPGPPTEQAQTVIKDVIAPFLIGKGLGDPDALRVLFSQGPGRDHNIQRIYCAVEIALYDLLGKAHNVPVSELIGGRMRDRIRLYGSAGMYMPPEDYAAEAEAIAELGFRAYKMRPGLGPEKDLETVRRVREAIGSSCELMIDAHTWWRMGDKSYSEQKVIEVAMALGEFEVTWLEEPLPPANHEAYSRLKETGLVPIASGEHEFNEESFLDLIQNNCVDYVQMDTVCQGGYPTARRILPELAKNDLRFAFHSWGTDLEVIAAAHLGVCWPETVVEWLEYPCYTTKDLKSMYPFPLASEMLKEPLQIENGELVVPRGHGLGIEINENVIEKYPWIPGPWSTFTLFSPRETWEVTGDHSVPKANS